MCKEETIHDFRGYLFHETNILAEFLLIIILVFRSQGLILPDQNEIMSLYALFFPTFVQVDMIKFTIRCKITGTKINVPRSIKYYSSGSCLQNK